MKARIPMLDRRFGRLVVLCPAPSTKEARWWCKCDCGAKHEAGGAALRRGQVASCGCYRRDRLSENKGTHRQSKRPEYAVWSSMIARCHRPTAQSYKNYGARGITVCDRWRNSFEAFWADMGPTYRPGLSIERKENDLGYSPDNCMWADRKTQCRNRRTTVRVLTPNGVMPLTDASERYGVRSDTLMWRIKAGWPTQRIFQK